MGLNLSTLLLLNNSTKRDAIQRYSQSIIEDAAQLPTSHNDQSESDSDDETDMYETRVPVMDQLCQDSVYYTPHVNYEKVIISLLRVLPGMISRDVLARVPVAQYPVNKDCYDMVHTYSDVFGVLLKSVIRSGGYQQKGRSIPQLKVLDHPIIQSMMSIPDIGKIRVYHKTTYNHRYLRNLEVSFRNKWIPYEKAIHYESEHDYQKGGVRYVWKLQVCYEHIPHTSLLVMMIVISCVDITTFYIEDSLRQPVLIDSWNMCTIIDL